MPITTIRTRMTAWLKSAKEEDPSEYEDFRKAYETLEAMLVKYGLSYIFSILLFSSFIKLDKPQAVGPGNVDESQAMMPEVQGVET